MSEVITVVHFGGRSWLKITRPWIRGRRPIVRYVPLTGLGRLIR